MHCKSKSAVSNQIIPVATFVATNVSTKLLLSPLLLSIERNTVYLSIEIYFWRTVRHHIQSSCRHMWRMATRLDNASLNPRHTHSVVENTSWQLIHAWNKKFKVGKWKLFKSNYDVKCFNRCGLLLVTTKQLLFHHNNIYGP